MDMSSIERGSEKRRALGQRALEIFLVGFVSPPMEKKGEGNCTIEFLAVALRNIFLSCSLMFVG